MNDIKDLELESMFDIVDNEESEENNNHIEDFKIKDHIVELAENDGCITYKKLESLDTDKQREILVNLRNQFTNQQIADMLGCHVHTLNKLIRNAGLSRRSYSNRDKNELTGLEVTIENDTIVISGDLNIDEFTLRLQSFLAFSGDKKKYKIRAEISEEE